MLQSFVSLCQSLISTPDALLKLIHLSVHPVNTQQTAYTTLQSDHELDASVFTKYQAADSSVSWCRDQQNSEVNPKVTVCL